jgi:hypothetical protein
MTGIKSAVNPVISCRHQESSSSTEVKSQDLINSSQSIIIMNKNCSCADPMMIGTAGKPRDDLKIVKTCMLVEAIASLYDIAERGYSMLPKSNDNN